MACVTWPRPVSMQPKTSSMTVVRARVGMASAMAWNQIRRTVGMLPSSGIIVFLRTLWLVSAHEIGESDPGSSPSCGKIFSVRSWRRSQIGSLFSGRNGHSYRAKVQTLVKTKKDAGLWITLGRERPLAQGPAMERYLHPIRLRAMTEEQMEAHKAFN